LKDKKEDNERHTDAKGGKEGRGGGDKQKGRRSRSKKQRRRRGVEAKGMREDGRKGGTGWDE
jgi:hypothetical protein